jgi:dienelactone hydrolase
MSNSVILKSYIGENMHTPNKDTTILISHGSSGITKAEYNIADYFCQLGYKVKLLDYFSSHGISKLWWNYKNNNVDTLSVGIRNMLTDFDLDSSIKYVHVGFSIGGYAGLLNNEKFVKNYCFYPGMLGFTENDVNKDYTNTTVITAEYDNWCDNYSAFEKQCNKKPHKITAKKCYHGFMLDDKDRQMDIAKYNFPNDVISEQEANDLKLDHNYLTEKYGYTVDMIRLKSNFSYSKLMLDFIKTDITKI